MLFTVAACTAALLIQDPGARPYTPAAAATRRIYRPPAIRPFETAPGPEVSDVETFFDEGVTAAERSADARAGPLDGRWRALGADGRPLLSLVLRDSGDGTVEGAWRRGADGRARLVQTISVDGSRAALVLDRHDTLRLQRSGDGWRGEFVHNGQARAVTLRRP